MSLQDNSFFHCRDGLHRAVDHRTQQRSRDHPAGAQFPRRGTEVCPGMSPTSADNTQGRLEFSTRRCHQEVCCHRGRETDFARVEGQSAQSTKLADKIINAATFPDSGP